MKKKFLVIIFLFIGSPVFAQGELKGVMGINFVSIPSMQDYINQNFAPQNNQLLSFISTVIFAGEGGLFLNKSFELTLETAYQIYSYTNTQLTGKYELDYNNFMPSILAYYVISGAGYNFKFGGGLGVRFASVNESLPATTVTITNYSSIGFGGIMRIEGNTLLGGNVYANIGAELRYDVNGEPEYNGEPLYNHIISDNVNFNTFSTGVRLGVTYIFGAAN